MIDVEPREKVRVYLRHQFEYSWESDSPLPSGCREINISRTKIRGHYFIEDQPTSQAPHPCKIDTGAELTIIPREIWEPHVNALKWLRVWRSDKNRPLTRSRGIGGGFIKLRFAVIAMHFVDFDERTFTRHIVAGCPRNTHRN